MKKILVTGAFGQLGTEIRNLAKGRKSFIFTDIRQEEGVAALDICDASAVNEFVKANNVGTIINCAAYTDVNGAESHQELCRKINVDGPVNLARAAKAAGGALIQISTDYVFDGTRKRGYYHEDDTCRPQSVYGATKRECELKLRRTGCRGIIIRTAWLYSPYGNNFVKTMLRLGSQKEEIGVVADQWGTPTYALDLAKAIVKFIDDYGKSTTQPYEKTGIYHFSNEGVCSWFDFSKMIAEYSGQTACDIQPCHSNEFPSPVTRPSYSVLDKTKIKETFGISIPYWTDSLKQCIKNILAT